MSAPLTDLVVQVAALHPVAYGALTVGGLLLSAVAAYGTLNLLSRLFKLRV